MRGFVTVRWLPHLDSRAPPQYLYWSDLTNPNQVQILVMDPAASAAKNTIQARRLAPFACRPGIVEREHAS